LPHPLHCPCLPTVTDGLTDGQTDHCAVQEANAESAVCGVRDFSQPMTGDPPRIFQQQTVAGERLRRNTSSEQLKRFTEDVSA